MKLEISIRQCGTGDAAMLCDLCERTFRSAFAAQNSADDMDAYVSENFTIERVAEELGTEGSIFFTAFAGEEPAAWLKLNFGSAQTEPDYPDSVEVQRIYVLEKFQRCGIGRTLMELAERIGRERGAKRIWLGVWECNTEALKFYGRMGFEKTGSHIYMLGSEAQNDFIMTRAIPPSDHEER